MLATVPRPLDIQPGGLRAAGGQAVRAVHATCRRGTSDDFLAPYEIETGNWMLQLVSQRANGETLIGCPMDYPAEVTHDVTLTGLRDTALAIIDDFPGPARRRRSTACGPACCRSRPTSVPIVDEVAPGSVRRRRPHLRQRRRADDRASSSARCWPGEEPEIDMSDCRWERDLESVAAGRPSCTGERPRRTSTSPTSIAPPGRGAPVRRAGGHPDRRRARAGRRVPGRPAADAGRARRARHVDPGRARRQRARPRRLRARLRGAGPGLDGPGQRRRQLAAAAAG